MPQLLSRVRPDAGIALGNGNDNPSIHRPQLALAAMGIIGEFSILESFMNSVFLTLLGTETKVGLSIYNAIASSSAKRAAVRAVAHQALSTEEQSAFSIIERRYNSVSNERNKLAHWIWGHSDQIPEGVLLCDPVKYMAHNAAFDAHLRERIARQSDAPARPDLKEIVYVYYDHDFNRIYADLRQVVELVGILRSLIRSGGDARAALLLQLQARLGVDK